MRLRLLVFGLVLGAACGAAAQERSASLGEIRRDLGVLYSEILALQDGLDPSAAPGMRPLPQPVLDRIEVIEAELRRLTDQTERLDATMRRVVADGTARVADLERRLVELEGGDASAIGAVPTLGAEPLAAGTGAEPAPEPASEPAPGAAADAPQLAVGEQPALDAASAALEAGNFQAAAEGFERFILTYPSGPLTPAAHLGRGWALAGLGEEVAAARAFLEAFSIDPDGPTAPEALFAMGETLAKLDQPMEACQTFAELAIRFPGNARIADAEARSKALSCP